MTQSTNIKQNLESQERLWKFWEANTDIFKCGLFNEAISNSDHIATNSIT